MDRFKIIGSRIKQIRERYGETQEELAAHLGYSQAAVAGYEIGRRRIGIEDLEKIADHYDVPFSHFLGRETEEDIRAAQVKRLVSEAQRLRQEVRQLESTYTGDTIAVPLIGTVPGGYPDFRDEEEAEEFYPIRRATIHPEGACCLQVTGNSMIGGRVFDGDIVFVDKTLNPERGYIVIARKDDEVVIRFYRDEDDGPYLEAASKGYRKLPLAEVEIIGVVVESRRTHR